MRMNLNNGNGDAPSSASLSESKDMMPCIIHRQKKSVWRKKGRCLILSPLKNKVRAERKEDASYCLLKKKGAHRKKVRESKSNG